MATNPPKGAGRVGAFRNWDQVFNPHNNRWTKRNDDGKLMNQKADLDPFKGVRKIKWG